jgi:hypothetical protein
VVVVVVIGSLAQFKQFSNNSINFLGKASKSTSKDLTQRHLCVVRERERERRERHER